MRDAPTALLAERFQTDRFGFDGTRRSPSQRENVLDQGGLPVENSDD